MFIQKLKLNIEKQHNWHDSCLGTVYFACPASLPLLHLLLVPLGSGRSPSNHQLL